MDHIAILLSGSAENAGGGTGGRISAYIICIVCFFVLFYLLEILPKSLKKQKREKMLKTMEVGDVVVTTCGFYGVLLDITDEDVIVEFGSNKNCRIPMRKSAIAEVEKADRTDGDIKPVQ